MYNIQEVLDSNIVEKSGVCETEIIHESMILSNPSQSNLGQLEGGGETKKVKELVDHFTHLQQGATNDAKCFLEAEVCIDKSIDLAF